ncbi:MAG TPA: hypothetical protein VMU86_03600 [Steroidobacteraceae bacterium]|nr:hypothetical protein [Steroidobacteraceae bacterium]
MATPANPIRVFVTHAWQETDDYLRIFEYLESPGTFYYANTSQPLARRPADRESEREELRRQIAPSEVVIVLPSIHRSAPELILFELNFAKSADRPVVALEYFGSSEPVPKPIRDLADEVVPWNDRELIDALRRQARHMETTRWDTIEFKLD